MEQVKDLFDQTTLESFKKVDLINIIMALQQEKNTLKSQQASTVTLMERVTKLERSQFLYEQYGRRESVEISGIPEHIEQKHLEKEVIKIYNEAKVDFHGRQVKAEDISACHRIGKRGLTIVRFVNRKFAYEGLRNGKNLKDSKLYDNPIFINNSFCREFSKYGYIIRQLKKTGLIEGYRIINGIYHIKSVGQEKFVEVSHVSDFEKYGLDVSHFVNKS